MFDLSTVFSSRARLNVLRVLNFHEAFLPLRHVAYLSQVPVFSVQRALQQLTANRLVIRKRKGLYRLFALNRGNLHTHFLSQVFDLERKTQADLCRGQYDRKAKNLLTFVNTAGNLLKGVKAEPHGFKKIL